MYCTVPRILPLPLPYPIFTQFVPFPFSLGEGETETEIETGSPLPQSPSLAAQRNAGRRKGRNFLPYGYVTRFCGDFYPFFAFFLGFCRFFFAA